MKVEELPNIIKAELTKIGYFEIKSEMLESAKRKYNDFDGRKEYEEEYSKLENLIRGKFIYTEFRLASFKKTNDSWHTKVTLTEWPSLFDATVKNPNSKIISISAAINDKTGEISELTTDVNG